MSPGRLTLSADKDVISLAHELAKQEKTSISAIFDRFIRARAHSVKPRKRLGPLTREASGMLTLPENFDYKECMADILMEKYGLKK